MYDHVADKVEDFMNKAKQRSPRKKTKIRAARKIKLEETQRRRG